MVAEYLADQSEESVEEIAARYGVSRQTLYNAVDRADRRTGADRRKGERRASA